MSNGIRIPDRNHDVWTGSGNLDGDVMIEITDADQYDTYVLFTNTGQCRVIVSFDKTNFSNPVALQDMAGTLIDQATPATTKNCFGLVIRTNIIRFLADGGASSVQVSAWASGRKT